MNYLTVIGSVLLVCSSLVVSLFAQAASPESEWGYVGTYTTGKSQGIYRISFDPQVGQLRAHGLAATAINPSFLAFHPAHDLLYAVNESDDFLDSSGKKGSGGVTAFQVDRGTGLLNPLNQQSTDGGAACHLVVDHTGRYVLIANYAGGNVAVVGLAEDGSLLAQTDIQRHQGHSIHPQRQQAPHAHSIDLDRSNQLAFSADLGLDKVLIYRFDENHGKLRPVGCGTVAPGAGPRHLAIHPLQTYAYVINELSSSVTVFRLDVAHATLSPIQSLSALPADFDGTNHAAEIHISSDGQFVYCSNRGHDSIAVFEVSPDTGTLRLIQHQSTLGKTPRHFTFDPTARFLIVANQASDNLVAFQIDQRTGLLQPSGQPIEVPSPVCVQFLARQQVASE